MRSRDPHAFTAGATAETAGVFFDDLRMSTWPSLEMMAGRSGQSILISQSQWLNLRWKKRSAQYSRLPSWSARLPVENSGMRTALPFNDQVFHASQRWRSRTPGALASDATSSHSTGSVREVALENLTLRPQLTGLKRRCPRARLGKADRLFRLCLPESTLIQAR